MGRPFFPEHPFLSVFMDMLCVLGVAIMLSILVGGVLLFAWPLFGYFIGIPEFCDLPMIGRYCTR